MPRRYVANALADRCHVVVEHAEFLADEACDAGLYADADVLREKGAKLAWMLEEADARHKDVEAATATRSAASALARRMGHRLCIEIETRLPFEEAIELVPSAHLAVESSTRFRIERLSARQREVLKDVVDDVVRAFAAHDDKDRACFAAVAAANAARARAVAVGHDLRDDCERAKARLLVTLDPGSDGWKRVSRRVIRTRRPDGWFARKLLPNEPVSPSPTTKGDDDDDDE